jgi:hypothetical protein
VVRVRPLAKARALAKPVKERKPTIPKKLTLQLAWADVNLIINKSRHPLIRVAGFLLPCSIALILNSSLKEQ